MSNHIKEITAEPFTHSSLAELIAESEGIVKEQAHDSFLRLEAMKVIHKYEEGELNVGELPDEETLEVMNFLGWFTQED